MTIEVVVMAMTKRTWKSKQESFLNFMEYRNGKQAREKIERVWSSMTNEEITNYIQSYWDDK